MTPRLTLALFGALLALTLATPAAATDAAGRATLGGDVFVAGHEVRVAEPVQGDLFATGGDVDVDAAVAGDLLAMGGKVRLRHDVGLTVYAAGGQLQIEGTVGRNLRVAGGQVELDETGQVMGNVSAAGGQLRLSGPVRGHVQMAGGDVLIDGPVAGDVTVAAGQLTLGPRARVDGRLRYRTGDDLKRHPDAQVAGGIERLLPSFGGRDPGHGGPAGGGRGLGVGAGLASVWTLGLMLVATVLVATLPGLTAGVSRTLRVRTGMSLLVGFALLVCTPVAIVLLLVTVVGLPLALLALAAYLALLPLAYVGAAIALGDGALRRWQAPRAERRRWRIGAACVALLMLTLLGWLPFVGWLVGIAALLLGLGALALQLARPSKGAA